ncbi:hypothetical protein EDM80_00050 [bacterium]|nr:MAG: hypothetical protein EDM80_00050 [bacterium]RIK65609.1 MAG: hypothetical protein DCC64_00380 [Planctomycetota bacterium]
MRILDEKQLASIIESMIPLQRELLPLGADLLALIAELEGAQATGRGYAGVARCIGEPAAHSVRETLQSLVYAFPVLKAWLLQATQPQTGSQAQPQIAAMLGAIKEATDAAMKEFEKLMSAGALTPEQVSLLRKELEDIAVPSQAPHQTPMSSTEKAMEVVARAEQEMRVEVEKLLKAADIDPGKVMPELAKLGEARADQPPPEAGASPEHSPQQPLAQGAKSQQDILAELEQAEQQVRSNLPQLEKQLMDAGVDRASIDQLLALLKSPA